MQYIIMKILIKFGTANPKNGTATNFKTPIQTQI